jgi:hypothetical protein
VSNGKSKTTRLWGRTDKGHCDEWRAFRNAICTGGPPPIQIEELLNTSNATFALLRSLAEQSWVNVGTTLLNADLTPDPSLREREGTQADELVPV